MKTDDPRLEKGRQEMLERAEKMDALTVAVLRSHLLAEQCVNDYILAKGVKRKWLREATFAEKIQKSKLLAKNDRENPLWSVLRSANTLRNTVAHTLAVDKIEQRMADLKEIYFSVLTPKQAEGLAREPDAFIAQSACIMCAGFVATLMDAAPGAEAASSAITTA